MKENRNSQRVSFFLECLWHQGAGRDTQHSAELAKWDRRCNQLWGSYWPAGEEDAL